MAALYLHQAIFTPEPSTPPVLVHASPSFRSSIHVPRQLSSISTVTLRTASNSDHSHPTEPLLHPPDAESSAYLDLLARQPRYLSSPSSPSNQPLSLEGDPVTPSERRSRWERKVRRRLRALRWAGHTLLTVIGCWAIYNTTRYFLAFTTYRYHVRQIILLALGTSTALSLTLVLVSLAVKSLAPRLGWIYRPKAPYVVLQAVLSYSSSALLLGPAVVNFIFVFLWRHAPSAVDTLLGRCHWDIDVFWSDLGAECGRSPAWGYWLAGATVRLVLTAIVLVGYHLTSYQYDVTRQPSRRRRRSRPRSGMSSPSTTATASSSRSFPPMSAALIASPVSIAQIGRQPSISTSEGHTTTESYGSAGEDRPLRSSRWRNSTHNFPAGTSRDVYQLPSAASPPRGEKGPGSPTVLPVDRGDASSNSSEEDLRASFDPDRYGRQVGRIPGTYASLHSPTSPGAGHALDMEANDPHSSFSDSELSSFAEHFRSLVSEISRETEQGIELAQNDRPGYYVAPFPAMDDEHEAHPGYAGAPDDDYVPVLGRTVHRMPTIESLGSREVMSLASGRSGSSARRASPGPHHLSRPSTRSNNLSMSEAGTSTPSTRSRTNSLDAALALASPAEDTREANAYDQEYLRSSPSPAAQVEEYRTAS